MAPKDFDPEYPDPDDPEDEDFDVDGEEDNRDEEEPYYGSIDGTFEGVRRDLIKVATRTHSLSRWNGILAHIVEEEISPTDLFTPRQWRRLRRRLVRRR